MQVPRSSYANSSVGELSGNTEFSLHHLQVYECFCTPYTLDTTDFVSQESTERFSVRERGPGKYVVGACRDGHPSGVLKFRQLGCDFIYLVWINLYSYESFGVISQLP